MSMTAVYAFRPLSRSDLPLVARWLAAPHVVAWWGDPGEQLQIVSGDIEQPAMDQFIVAADERPFGYLQCYDPAAWPENGFGALAPRTRGIDKFIGEPDMIHRGHGSAFIRMFVERLLTAGTPQVVTDPDPGNVRAIRANEKAGFKKDRLVDTPEGRTILMVRSA
jgi:aminoglycoside 6'-N-acetyltransferase